MQCLYAGTMLPDYWGGHHLAHVGIYVWPEMLAEDIKASISSELFEGAVTGSDYDEDLHDAYIKAVDDLEILSEQPFLGCDLDEESMAYFVFKED